MAFEGFIILQKPFFFNAKIPLSLNRVDLIKTVAVDRTYNSL